jgi:hypothetical protein
MVASMRGLVSFRLVAGRGCPFLWWSLSCGLLSLACSRPAPPTAASTPSIPPVVVTAALCTTPRDPGPSPVRRLTRTEYAQTFQDLLGPGAVDVSALPPDEEALGFDNNADVMSTSDLLVEEYDQLAEQAGDWVASHLSNFAAFAACASGPSPDAACADTLIAEFGRRAWRHPLSAEEAGDLAAVFAAGNADGGFEEGVARVVAVALQSPQFLYRVEVGGALAGDLGGAVALTSSELASRLSYLFLGSLPDDGLLAAAEADRLLTAEGLAAEARRLLGDARAHAVVTRFHGEWLGLDGLDTLDKDPVIYPAFDDGLRAGFRAESERFVDEVVWNGAGTLTALLGSNVTFVDAELAAFYGVPAPAAGTGTGLGRVVLDARERAGFLTEGAILAVHAKPNQSSPVQRGRFVREQLFCTTPPPPPPNIAIQPPLLDPRKTTRERFVEHTADPFCASCHTQLDPIGFGFEHYDGIGHWRDTESGLPVDGSGMLTGTDVDGPFDGAPALAAQLAASAEVRRCYATEWFRFAYGRGETTADACTLAELAGAFDAADGDVRALMVALTQTDAFRYRRQEGMP